MASDSNTTGAIVPSPRAGDSRPAPPPPPPVVQGTATTDQPIEAEISESERTQRLRDDPRIPGWLASTILHTIALVVLYLLSYSRGGADFGITLTAQRGDRGETVSFQAVNEQPKTLDDSAADDQPVPIVVQFSESRSFVPAPMLRTIDAAAIEELRSALLASGGQPSDAKLTRLPGGGLSGRTPEGRQKYGERFGATRQSEDAVELALQWLAEHQRANGSWSFDLSLDPCNGRCKHSKKAGDTPTPSTGATGLALLSFLGAGYTHKSGKYAETVRRGIYYLRSVAGEAQFGLDWQQGSMYGHGIALMALGEALSMTTDEDGKYDSDLYELVRRGADFTDAAQHDNGSWGYVPGSPGDTTLTGWQVMSLVAAKRNGVDLRTNTLPRAKSFIRDVVGNDQFEFGYKGPPAEPTMTAIGLTLLLYLGETPGITQFDRAFDRLAARGPMLTNVYHDYYATLALHHVRHRDWDRWNARLRNHLVTTQSKQGHQRGSWHFQDKWGDIGGRLYTTCMCTMMLEVYYRYLPLYDQLEEFPL